jgi:hypothetical protein
MELARVKLTIKGRHTFEGRLSPCHMDGDLVDDAITTRRKAPNPPAETRRCGLLLRGRRSGGLLETRCVVSLRRPARSPYRA